MKPTVFREPHEPQLPAPNNKESKMAFLIPNFDLAEKIGQDKVEINAATVDDLVKQAESRFGAAFTEAIKRSTLVVNGRAVSKLKGGRTPLKPADSVWIITPSGGG